MNPKSRLLAIALAFSLVGCVTQVSSPSRRPEVTIKGHSVDEVRAAIVEEAVASGYVPVKSEGLDLLFDREAPAGMSFLLSGLYPARTQLRVSIMPASSGEVRVIAIPMVAYQAGGSTRSDELTGKNITNSLALLSRAQVRLH